MPDFSLTFSILNVELEFISRTNWSMDTSRKRKKKTNHCAFFFKLSFIRIVYTSAVVFSHVI